MAYITKEQVQEKNQKLKLLNRQYGVTARFSGSNSSVLCLKITAGQVDFVSNFVDCIKQDHRTDEYQKQYSIRTAEAGYIGVNHYYIKDSFCGVALEYLQKAYEIMLEWHWDKSDTQIDYFNTSWYNNIKIGDYGRAYRLK